MASTMMSRLTLLSSHLTENKFFWAVVRSSQLLAMVPLKAIRSSESQPLVRFRFRSLRTVLSVFIAILSALSSWDIYTSARFLDSSSVTTTTLIIAYTFMVYIGTLWVRLASVMNGAKLARIINTIQRLERSTIIPSASCSEAMENGCGKCILLARIVAVLHISHIFYLFIQDQYLYYSTLPNLKVIPPVPCVVLILAFFQGAISATTLLSAALFPVLAVMRIARIQDSLINELHSAFRNNRVVEDGLLNCIPWVVSTLRSCLEDLNEVNFGMLLPMVMSEASLCIAYLYATIMKPGVAPRYMEHVHFNLHFILLLLPIYFGSFMDKRVTVWKDTMRQMSIYDKQSDRMMKLVKLASCLSDWNWSLNAGGFFRVNMSLMSWLVQSFLAAFIYLKDLNSVVL